MRQISSQQTAHTSLATSSLLGLNSSWENFSSLNDLAEQICSYCEKLNRLSDNRSSLKKYIEEYQSLSKLEACIAKLPKEQDLVAKPLLDLFLGLIHYYSPLGYTYGDFRSITHSSRWPEFKRLIRDELSIINNIPVTSLAEELSRAESHKALLNIHYDRNNFARPWDTGPELDCLTALRQARTRSEVRQVHADCKSILQIDLPVQPYQSHNDGAWNRVFDQFWVGMSRLSLRIDLGSEVESIKSLMTVANFTREALRPECYKIQKVVLEIADSYLNLLLKNVDDKTVSNLNFSNKLSNIRDLVYGLEKEYAEYRYFRGETFVPDNFERAYDSISYLGKDIQQSISQHCGGNSCVEFSPHSLEEGFAREQLIQNLADIEKSRTTGERNSLKVAYGANELKELFERRNSRLFVYYSANVPVGFSLVELDSPKLPTELQPLLQAAKEERGNVPYAYLHLVVINKGAGTLPYRAIMQALDDCAQKHGLVYTLGWCRLDNTANIIHLKAGGELLPGSIRITEHGNTMHGRNLLRTSSKRGLQQLVSLGDMQARLIREELKASS